MFAIFDTINIKIDNQASSVYNKLTSHRAVTCLDFMNFVTFKNSKASPLHLTAACDLPALHFSIGGRRTETNPELLQLKVTNQMC